MNWTRIIASYLVIAQMVFAPAISHAVTPGLEVQDGKLTEEGKKNVAALSEYAAKLKYDSHLDLKNNKMILRDRDTKNVVGEVVLRDQKSLMEYSPSTINSKLISGISNLKIASKQSAEHAWKSFPIESAAFFLALGGMTAVQLLTNYADNPIGMKQHIEHSLSPVGQMGFFMFMYSQGVTSNALTMLLKRPKLGMPIGMLGMTVGMAVQSYFTQVVGDPHLRNCAASVFKGEKIEGNDHPCEGAYKYLVVDKKILEGPGIASLLGSFLVVTGARIAVGSVLRIIGIEITTLLIPGGVEVKGVRWLIALASSGINAALFTVVQMKMEHYFSYAWKNYFDGKEFVKINDDLVEHIEAQKKSQWTSKAGKFNADLKNFSKKMSAWRVNNLSEAYMANQAWSGFLAEMTSTYTASYNFYDIYIQELLGKDSLIDRSYPLHGVKPKNMAEGHEDNFLTRPDRVEAMQVETVKDVAAFVGANLKSGYYKKLAFDKTQMEIINKIHAGLASQNINAQGKALIELNDARRVYNQNRAGSQYFSTELFKITKMLGAPNPMFEKGRGFAATMTIAPSVSETFKDAKLDRYNGLFRTPTAADFFVVQMICGPDTTKNEKVIKVTKGFPAKFKAPTITLDDKSKDTLCSGNAFNQTGAERIYNLPAGSSKTAPEFLRANINPAVAQNFDAWWESHTEAELKEAFQGFGKSYKTVVDKLYKGLYETKNSAWNRGLISNGAMIAAFQEARLYSLVLGEILKDTYKAQNKTALPAKYFTSEADQKSKFNVLHYTATKKPLLGLLGYSARYDFDALTNFPPKESTQRLKIQKEIDAQFAGMNALIIKAKTKSIKTDVYQAQMKSIENKLSEFSALLGVKKADDSENVSALVKLNPEQRALAVTCLELLQALSQELTMYGNMAGTARYPDSK